MTTDFVGVISGASVEITGVLEQAKSDKIKEEVAAFVRRNNDVSSAGSQSEVISAGLRELATGPCFISEADTRGYYARFHPGAMVLPDVLLPRRGYGQLMALEIKLDECPAYRAEDGTIRDPTATTKELYWAAFGAPVPSATEPPQSMFTSVDGKLSDARPWAARLVGHGSFVGLFGLASSNPEIGDGKRRGLLVAYGTSLANQQANKRMIADAINRPNYGEFASDKLQLSLRRKQARNVAIVLHNAATALGCPEAAFKRIEDREAREGVPAEQLDARRLAMHSLSPKPMKLVPDIHLETDFMRAQHGTHQQLAVEYFNGVASTSSAVGGLIAFAGADPAKGLHVLRDFDRVKSAYWDGGFTAVKDWNLRADLAADAQFYERLVFVTEQ